MKKEYINPKIRTVELPRLCLNIGSEPAGSEPAGAKEGPVYIDSLFDIEDPLNHTEE